MLLRALAAFLVCPAMVAGAIPLLIERRWPEWGAFAGAGAGLLLVGLILLLWCVRDFLVAGRGTLAPWDPPKRLVVVGLYRLVRNPMYVAVLTIVLGWGAVFRSPLVALYGGSLAVIFHWRVVLQEEPGLRGQFGDEWKKYAHRVPRWWPRWP